MAALTRTWGHCFSSSVDRTGPDPSSSGEFILKSYSGFDCYYDVGRRGVAASLDPLHRRLRRSLFWLSNYLLSIKILSSRGRYRELITSFTALGSTAACGSFNRPVV